MKEITVISGKGGTGKTTITASLAHLMDTVIADCDVDAPNLKYILNPRKKSQNNYKGTKHAVISENCTHCGKCKEVCRFDAIKKKYKIEEEKCEGCGTCKFVCPSNAIELKEKITGKVIKSQTRFGLMIHAELKIGEEASGKLVSKVKETAREAAEDTGKNILLIDGSPGTGCPVIASIGGSDLALVVTEPTASGIHDLKRVLDVVKHFNVKPLVCINKYDLNIDKTQEITDFCNKNEIEIVSKLPYSNVATEAMLETKTVTEHDDSIFSEKIGDLYNNLKNHLE